MAQIIDGKALSLSLKEEMRSRVEALADKYGRRPCLAVIMVGDNPASHSYIRGKVKAAEFVGIDSKVLEFPENISERELLSAIENLNEDDGVDGILVQLPLPQHIDVFKVTDAISVSKDVDGFHPQNVAALWQGRKCTVPCTPKGILRMIQSTGVDITGRKALVIGRSNIVGKPVSKLLLDNNATVSIAHSRTRNLAEVCRSADILVVAAGHPKLVTGDMIKPGAIIIDVGINRLEDGRITGDVDFETASKTAAYISPVPGGVGPMTIAMLMENTIECFQSRF